MKVRVRALRRRGAVIVPPPNVWHDALLETRQHKAGRYLVVTHPLSALDKLLLPAMHAVLVVQVDPDRMRLRGIENCEGAAVNLARLARAGF